MQCQFCKKEIQEGAIVAISEKGWIHSKCGILTTLNMRKYRNTPLTPEEIEVIERLVEKGDSERQIESITGHSRNTIRFYKREYIERKRIAEKLEKAMDKYYGTPNIKVYSISFGFVWLVLFTIIGLSAFGLYFLINL